MTNTQIQNLKPGEILWDNDSRVSVKGLFLRAGTRGEKTFYFHYRTRAGAQRKPKIGTLGEITVADARRRAKALMEQVFIGKDPGGDWDAQKAEMTVADLYAKVLAKYWDTERFRNSGRYDEVEAIWRNHVGPEFGKLPLSAVTISRVRTWHQGYLETTPTQGNRALEVLSRCFEFAQEYEIRPMGTNPCSYVKGHPERKRRRFASEEELQRLHAILQREAAHYPQAVAFIYLLAFTGSRPQAIAKAKWSDLVEVKRDGKRYGILTFKGKMTAETGEDESVVIPPEAMAVLDRLERTEDGTLTGLADVPHKRWWYWRMEAGCPDLWIRDLRRTFATVGMSGGVGKDQIGRLLNHKSAQTTDLYARLTRDASLAAAAAVAEKVDALLRASPKGERPKLTLVKSPQ